MTKTSILSAENLTKRYASGNGEVRALNGISLSLEAGDFVAMHGPSGCGKSTFLLIAGGLLSPHEGRLRIAGKNPYALSPGARSAFRAEHIGFVFQQFHLIPYLDVLDNLLVNELTPGETPDLRNEAGALLEKFQLSERIHHLPSQLSVGEQQRVALARAMLRRPKLLLADEPTGNLDTENSRILLSSLKEFSAEGGAVLMVTHDERARQAAGRSIKMKAGEIVDPSE